MKEALIVLIVALVSVVYAQAQRGMPQENRDAIHALLAAHKKIERKVTPTADGYEAVTTSGDEEVVALLHKHVAQMDARMKKGLMVRRWDPAYKEFVEHYDDIEIKIQKMKDGVKVVTHGKTPAAIKVARNHASIITKFVGHGFEEARKPHAAVTSESSEEPPASEKRGKCDSGDCARCSG